MNQCSYLFPEARALPGGNSLHGVFMGRVIAVDPTTYTAQVEVEDGSTTIKTTVSTLHAHNGRGWTWLPEEGELVVVAFLGGAKVRPVILGSMFDSRDPLPNTQGGSATLYHQSGTKIQIDANGDLHLTHTSGSDVTVDANNHTVTHHGTTAQIQSNGDVVITHANSQKLLLSGTRVEADSAAGTTKLAIDDGSAILSSGAGTIQINESTGQILISPGIGTTVVLGGGSNPAVMNGDITGPAIGVGVPAHFHSIIGGSTKVVLT